MIECSLGLKWNDSQEQSFQLDSVVPPNPSTEVILPADPRDLFKIRKRCLSSWRAGGTHSHVYDFSDWPPTPIQVAKQKMLEPDIAAEPFRSLAGNGCACGK